MLGSKVALDTPYFLFSDTVDWQGGYALAYVGARDPAVPVQQFTTGIQQYLLKLQRKRPAGMDGAVACVSSLYVVYWEHWQGGGEAILGILRGAAP